MKGLIQKDLYLMLGRSKTLLILLAVGVMMMISSTDDGVISYLTILSSITAISTISYDEFDNGYPFIFSLPISKKDYVRSKYVFCFAMSLVGLLIGIVVMYGVSTIIKKPIEINLFETIISSITLAFLMAAFMIPLQLKYGAEKSRVAIVLVAAACTSIGYLGLNLLAKVAPIDFTKIVLTDGQITCILIGVSILLVAISYFISIKVMNNKEF